MILLILKLFLYHPMRSFNERAVGDSASCKHFDESCVSHLKDFFIDGSWPA